MHNIVFIDDDLAFAGGQLQLINQLKGYSCTQIFRNVEEASLLTFEPDVVFIRLDVSRLDRTAISILLKRFPKALLAVYVTNPDIKVIFTLLEYGFHGIVDSFYFSSHIEDVLCKLINYKAFLSPAIIKQCVDYYSEPAKNLAVLTPRELEVAGYLQEGISYKDIALKCEISLDTVRLHIRNTYRKLNINSKIQLVNCFRRFN